MEGAIAFRETTGDRHTQVVGGLTALERRIREQAKAGATKAVVAAAPGAIARPLPIPVEWVAPGSAAPEGAQRERADVIAGVELVDEAARARAEWALLRRMNKSFEGPVDALLIWLIAAALMAHGGWGFIAAAGVLLELISILDSCDGELARLRYQYSMLGQWLDNLSDDIVAIVFIIAAGAACGGMWTWLGLAAACGRRLVSIVT